MVGAEYEFLRSEEPAHWLRMEMFDRPQYDNVLYVDLDVVIHRDVFVNKNNIFSEHGIGAPNVDGAGRLDPSTVNCGVLKFTREQCVIMRDHIDEFYDHQRNQSAINACIDKYIDGRQLLSSKWNELSYGEPGEHYFRHLAGRRKRGLN